MPPLHKEDGIGLQSTEAIQRSCELNRDAPFGVASDQNFSVRTKKHRAQSTRCEQNGKLVLNNRGYADNFHFATRTR